MVVFHGWIRGVWDENQKLFSPQSGRNTADPFYNLIIVLFCYFFNCWHFALSTYYSSIVTFRAANRPLFFGLTWPVAWPVIALACLGVERGGLLIFLAWPGLTWQAIRHLPRPANFCNFSSRLNSMGQDWCIISVLMIQHCHDDNRKQALTQNSNLSRVLFFTCM